ncbi:GTPase Era [Rhodospirillaceae bacterium KN72]|uniref:GTPase Era n=1 Tax=Pacificispira spongiicola TaxID=2729598 RepID=A0A7Y0DZG8_9PROT|nr:GTPase Era [Pacificispira spongiicola]NMM44457.1 GTPase Era [Pacificispira spongiicola]
MTDASPEMTRCGFVAVIGAPNAGKSTLVNLLVGAKVTIVTHKVQTTRTRVLGIALRDETQVCFIDTPGIFKPKRRLDRAMVSAAWQGAQEADATVLLIDAHAGVTDEVEDILKGLEKEGRKAVLALNKIDMVKREILLALADRLNKTGLFTDIFMISAENGDGTEDLMAHLVSRMAPGPWLFPEDQLSDMPQMLLAAEVTREKLFLNVHQELPYALTVETESYEVRKDGSIRIEQVVYVERESQRAIILGKNGAKVKTVGSAARKELEEMFESKVHLFLYVKVRDRWQDDPERYRMWNLDFQA